MQRRTGTANAIRSGPILTKNTMVLGRDRRCDEITRFRVWASDKLKSLSNSMHCTERILSGTFTSERVNQTRKVAKRKDRGRCYRCKSNNIARSFRLSLDVLAKRCSLECTDVLLPFLKGTSQEQASPPCAFRRGHTKYGLTWPRG